ncbi:MAG: PASTA domain-containing protein, partial [Phycisphaeraceae bacterium]|nr:PASTA domain-containing protein [Phycisphaeraceae bacterium]
RVNIRSNRTVSGFLPRVLLRSKSGRSRKRLSETPVKYTRTLVDFGELTVSSAVAMRVARTPFYASNVTVAAGGGASPAARITSLNTQLKSLKSTNTQLTSKIAEKDKALKSKEAVFKKQAKQLKLKTDEVDKLKGQIARLKETGPAGRQETNIEELLDNASRQIENVSSSMNTRKSRYRLGKISMQLKMLPSAGGTGVNFIKPAEIEKAKPELLSQVNLEFDPSEQQAPAQAPEQVAVPDVTGYTRDLALRKLAEADLEYEWREEVVAETSRGRSQDGRVLRQRPEAGEETAPGSVVTITIGRAH